MRKYVYMIDYTEDGRCDQIECVDKKDLITQLKIIAEENTAVVDNVKLVENENRYFEEDISYTLSLKVKSILGYKPTRLTHSSINTRV